jgi:RNA recognition motif-containing protein
MMDHLERGHALDVSLSEVACPLCLEYSSSDRDALSLHLSRHMEEIALAILPSTVDSDIDSDLESINDSKTVSDTKLDNISNTRSPSDSPWIADHGARSRLSNAENDKDSFAHSANVPAADDNSRDTSSNLFVTGIHPSLTEEELTLLFERYGQVEGCTIIRDPHSKESRGFGFVNMITSAQADAAKEGLQGFVHNGRTLSIENARTARPLDQPSDSPFAPIGISDVDEESSPADMLPGVSDGHFPDYISQQHGVAQTHSHSSPARALGEYVFLW